MPLATLYPCHPTPNLRPQISNALLIDLPSATDSLPLYVDEIRRNPLFALL
jgi:hypothetical protein